MNFCRLTKIWEPKSRILIFKLNDSFIVFIESRQVAFFCAKLLRTGGTSSATQLSVYVRAREPPQIFSFLKNLGIPFLTCLHTCLFTPFVRSFGLHEKRPALPEKLNRASRKGKRLELKHFNISEL